MHKQKIIESGNTSQAKKALVMLHGRGSNAQNILSLSSYLDAAYFTLYAPQATNNTWYPYSFLAEPARNEPWLSSALGLVGVTVDKAIERDVAAKNIYFLGFSHGACLTLEYVARNARKYGGVIAFTGGLIGDRLYTENYNGNFERTPIFIGTSNPDPHIPIERIHDTTSVLKKMGANVIEKVYPDMGHTINENELDWASRIIHNK